MNVALRLASSGACPDTTSRVSLSQSSLPFMWSFSLLRETVADRDSSSPSPAPMSDNELDAPGSPEEDAPLYSLEGKYHDAEDRENILRMPEIEREAILADRAQEVLKRQQDQQLKKALAAARSSAASKNKRSAKDADLDDDSGRRATRPKAEKARNALDDYKRAREMKGDRGRGMDSGRDRRTSRSPSSAGSDRDAEGESEVEWAEPCLLYTSDAADE